MATHSSVFDWRIPGSGEPGGCCLWGHTELDTTEMTQQQDSYLHGGHYSRSKVEMGNGNGTAVCNPCPQRLGIWLKQICPCRRRVSVQYRQDACRREGPLSWAGRAALRWVPRGLLIWEAMKKPVVALRSQSSCEERFGQNGSAVLSQCLCTVLSCV